MILSEGRKMKIKLVFDSSIAYTEAEKEKANIDILPFLIVTLENKYRDFIDITPKHFYDLLEQDLDGKTSQPDLSETIELFRKLLNESDYVLYFTIPEELSGTYRAGVSASKEVSDARIHVVDLKTGLGASRYLAKKLNEMIDEGRSLPEIIEKANSVKYNSRLFILPDNIEYLKKSGRVNNMASAVFSLIKMRIALELRVSGFIDKFQVSKSDKKLFDDIFKDVKEKGYNAENSVVYLINTNADERIEEARKMIEEEFKGIEIIDMYLAPTIGAHVGPKSIALQFIKKDW